MKVHVSYIQGAFLREYERTYVPHFSQELARYGRQAGITLESDPKNADIIILWSGFEYKTIDYITVLENDPLIQAHADKVYTINYEDHPQGFLAGLHTSLEAPFFDSTRHRIWPFYQMNNPRVYDLTREDVMAFRPTKLFSFRGAASHIVRKRLFQLYSKPSHRYHVEHVKRWYDHDDEDRLKFARVALDSEFCLCPHGYTAYTPRITEVMSMARVPVIIADGWIPISFPESLPYYVMVAEKDIIHLEDILSARRADLEEYRQNARMLWERHCSIQRRAISVAECIGRLATRPGSRPTYDAYRQLWRSKEFLSNAGWTFRQHNLLRLEQHLQRVFPKARVPGISDLTRYRNPGKVHE